MCTYPYPSYYIRLDGAVPVVSLLLICVQRITLDKTKTFALAICIQLFQACFTSANVNGFGLRSNKRSDRFKIPRVIFIVKTLNYESVMFSTAVHHKYSH